MCVPSSAFVALPSGRTRGVQYRLGQSALALARPTAGAGRLSTLTFRELAPGHHTAGLVELARHA